MEPFVTSLVTEIAAGAVVRLAEHASGPVRDAYGALKARLLERVPSTEVRSSIENLELEPTSPTAKSALENALRAASLERDDELLERIKALESAIAASSTSKTVGIAIGSVANAELAFEDIAASGPSTGIQINDLRGGRAQFKNVRASGAQKRRRSRPDETTPIGVSINSVVGGTITLGADAAELAAQVREAYRSGLAHGSAEAHALSKKLGVAEAAIHNFLRLLHEAEIPVEEAFGKLQELAVRYQELIRSTQLLRSDDPEIDQLRQKAVQAVEAGPTSYEEADKLFEEAEAAECAAAQDLTNAAGRRMLNAAAMRAQRAELALLDLDYERAAMHYFAAYEMAPQSAEQVSFRYACSYAECLFEHGKAHGEMAALGASIVTFAQLKEALEDRLRAGNSELGDSTDWARITYNLGLALQVVGTREPDTANLYRALGVFRQLSKGYSRTRTPAGWAMMQRAIGSALWQIGQREAGTKTLREAASVLRRAYRVQEKAHDAAFTLTLDSLGAVLKTIGERESDSKRLHEAVALYEHAIAKLSREGAERECATVRINLGAALTRLGERSSGTKELEEAAASYRLAAAALCREREPMLWAAAQNNLSRVLWLLGERTSSADLFRESLSSIREALEIRTRETDPFEWAMSQNNLANTLSSLAHLTSDAGMQRQAVAAFRNALTEYTRDRVPLDWGVAMNNLGNALTRLGAAERNVAVLREAVVAYENALLELTIQRTPIEWAMAQSNLGATLSSIADLGDRSTLPDAAVALRKALLVYTRDNTPYQWAATCYNLGTVLQAHGEDSDNTLILSESIYAFSDALTVYRADRYPEMWKHAMDCVDESAAELRARAATAPGGLAAAGEAFVRSCEELTESDSELVRSRREHALRVLLEALPPRGCTQDSDSAIFVAQPARHE
jgi:tetratricopeptide (TPR) repeat protein